MGFEIGFATKDYNEGSDWTDSVFWYWCGWDNTSLFEAFSALSNEGITTVSADQEVHIPIDKLQFIEILYNRLNSNPFYIIRHKLLTLNQYRLATEYYQNITVGQQVSIALEFYFEDDIINQICTILYVKEMIDNQFIIDSLYKAYRHAKALNLKEVVLYNG